LTELAPGDSNDDDEPPGEELDNEAEESLESEEGRPVLTDDRQLSLDDAEDLAARHGLEVVLLAGEVASGKTTLLVALWHELLARGRVGDVAFAGSRTALGFERRAWLSRLNSREERATTRRTYQEDNGFLHLRLAVGNELHELLLSDVAGETFKRVRQGEPLNKHLTWLPRVDAAMVLVDGRALADDARRSTALSNTRSLLKQLHKAAEPDSMRVAVMLTMADLVAGGTRKRWEKEAPHLLELAQALDKEGVVLETAARPEDGAAPVGLELVTAWLLSQSEPATPEPPPPARSTRIAGRSR
jgi:ABC-type cobalamin/Fe3+-siderophores transport system ATPase subunit